MDSTETTPLLQPATKESEVQARIWWWCKFSLPPVCLFVVGTVVLSISEQWPVLTSAYVVTQIFTTIGYGDFVVEKTPSKIFVALWAIIVLSFAAYAIGALADMLLQSQADMIRRHLRQMQMSRYGVRNEKEAKDRFGHLNKLIAALIPALLFLLFGTVFFRYLEHCTCGMEKVAGCTELPFSACAATGGYVKTWGDTFYMSVITLTTVGFGDFQPRTAVGRLISIPWMFLGVFIFANGISTLASYFYESKKSNKMMAVDAVTSIDKDMFNKIDRDGNGYLDKGEFLAYSLLKYEVVSEELINDIFKEYDKFEGAKDRRVTHAMIAERQQILSQAATEARASQGFSVSPA